MTDIVQRLRNATWGDRAEWAETCLEAAAEIERLKTQLYHATAAVVAIREHALEEAAQVAKNGCLVPPDGGSPTDDERIMCERIAAAIRALKENQ